MKMTSIVATGCNHHQKKPCFGGVFLCLKFRSENQKIRFDSRFHKRPSKITLLPSQAQLGSAIPKFNAYHAPFCLLRPTFKIIHSLLGQGTLRFTPCPALLNGFEMFYGRQAIREWWIKHQNFLLACLWHGFTPSKYLPFTGVFCPQKQKRDSRTPQEW